MGWIRCTLVDEPLSAGLEFELYKNSNKQKTATNRNV